MSRPRKYGSHKLEAYEFYMQRESRGEDVSALDIRVDLEEEHPEGTASYRLIADWVREFKNRDEWQTFLDSPFQWHLMATYGLPWEASAYLMDILYLISQFPRWKEIHLPEPTNTVRLRALPPATRTLPLMPLTVREAVWCWRVHLAAPEIGASVGVPWDVYYLAGAFASREITRDVLDSRPQKADLKVADLEALLVYKPWLSEERHQAYHKAVDDSDIPPLLDTPWTLPRRGNVVTMPLEFRGYVVPLPKHEHPELLVSQQIERLMKQAKEGKEQP